MEQVLVLGLVLVVGSLISGVEPCPPLKRETCNEIDGEREKGREVEERGEKGKVKGGHFGCWYPGGCCCYFSVVGFFVFCFLGRLEGVLCFRFKLGQHPVETRQCQRGTLTVHPLHIGSRR